MTKVLTFKRLDSLASCEKIWKEFAPSANIFDTWEFRYCFYKYFNFPLNFIVGYFGGEAVGLLALEYNTEDGYLEFFGGYFMYDNRVMLRPGFEDTADQFFGEVKGQARLDDIAGLDKFESALPASYYKYTLDLKTMKEYGDYLKQKLTSKKRSDIKRNLKIIQQEKIDIVENNFVDLDILIELNKKSFGGQSSFFKPFRKEIFNDLLKPPFSPHLLSFNINGKTEAVSLGMDCNGSYTFLNMGKNDVDFSNLKTYVVIKNIQRAIDLRCAEFDAGLEDFGWKEDWGFSKTAEHHYYLNLSTCDGKAVDS